MYQGTNDEVLPVGGITRKNSHIYAEFVVYLSVNQILWPLISHTLFFIWDKTILRV